VNPNDPYAYTPWGPPHVIGFPIAVKLVSEVAQARLRAAATIASTLADTVSVYAGSMGNWANTMTGYWGMPPQAGGWGAPPSSAGWRPAPAPVPTASRPQGTTTVVEAHTSRTARVSTAEGDESYFAYIELPAADPNDISVVVDGDRLEVTARNRADARSADYSASVPIPDGVDREHISAEYRDGVLQLRLQKEAKKSRRELRVNVTGASSSRPPKSTP
jgi:HSP20 family protein